MPRLINVDTLQMREFFEPDIPPYAILSHTWDDEEITFQDWQTIREFHELRKALVSEDSDQDQHFAANSYAGQQQRKVNAIKAKAGYQKVLDFCTVVETRYTVYTIEWAWIDTCCIDKTSSAELSEAINSMYRWYQNSKVCLVYLSDVLARKANEPELFEKDFLKSRWTTRGWTLQELLAPYKVDFYDAKWNSIGGAHSLEGLLTRATGIEPMYLNGYGSRERRNQASVSTRMSWAARRKTTRAEDTAYCLLGIFGVNMPLLYGEGGPRAFTRLQEEIMKQSTDHTIFAWGYGMALVGEGIDETGYKWAISVRESHWDNLLAPSPAYFINGHLIQRVSLHRELPFQLTNQGLQISLVLRKVEDIPGTYIALLNCGPVSPPTCLRNPFAGIYLTRSSPGIGKIKDGDIFLKRPTSKPTTVDVRDSRAHYTPNTVIIQRPYKPLNPLPKPLPTFDLDIRGIGTLQPSNRWRLQQVLPQLQALELLGPIFPLLDTNELCLRIGVHDSFHQARSRQHGERDTMVLLSHFTGSIRFVLRVKADYSNEYKKDGGWKRSSFWNWTVSHKSLDSPGYRCPWKPIPLERCSPEPAEPSNNGSSNDNDLGGLPYRAILHAFGSCCRGTIHNGYILSILLSDSAAGDGAIGQEYNAELLDTPHDVALLQGDEKLYRPEDFDEINIEAF